MHEEAKTSVVLIVPPVTELIARRILDSHTQHLIRLVKSSLAVVGLTPDVCDHLHRRRVDETQQAA